MLVLSTSPTLGAMPSELAGLAFIPDRTSEVYVLLALVFGTPRPIFVLWSPVPLHKDVFSGRNFSLVHARTKPGIMFLPWPGNDGCPPQTSPRAGIQSKEFEINNSYSFSHVPRT